MIDLQTLKDFYNKLTVFWLFNLLFLLWILTQIVFYSLTINSISCSPMTSLWSSWLAGYLLQLFVPIVSTLIARRQANFIVAYIVLALAALFKVELIVTMVFLGGSLQGFCYIMPEYRLLVIIINLMEMICLLIQNAMLRRINKANSQETVLKVAEAKKFIDN